MGLFLFRFWPVLIPLVAYVLWMNLVRRKAEKEGKPKPAFRDGPWYWAVLTSLLIAIGCFFLVAMGIDEGKGSYTPPHLEGGKIVPGQVGK